MSLDRRVRVSCNVCGALGDLHRTATEAWMTARRSGWRTLPGGVDLCPEHRQATVAEVRELQQLTL
jgi:hypothetical protein